MMGTTGAAQFAISPGGSLLYINDIPERSQRTLARLDGQGRSADLPIPPRAFSYLAVCGDRLAATVFARGQTELPHDPAMQPGPNYARGVAEDDVPHSQEFGRFSRGQEQLPDDHVEKLVEGRFSEGQEESPTNR